MRTAYMGTSEFAATVLERLARSRHRPTVVFSRPDRQRGRGRRLQSPPVVEAARGLGIEVSQPEDVNDPESRERVAAAAPDVVVICAYGALIREPLLSAHAMINVHPSLLPRWRGAAPVERAIEAGDSETGVSIMRPVAELDAGPVFAQRSEPIRSDDDYGSLSARLAEISGELLEEVLDAVHEPTPQAVDGATYAVKIEREDRRLDTDRAAEELARLVRALNPHVGVYAELEDGERLGVRRATLYSGTDFPAPGDLDVREGKLLLGARAGALELIEVQPAGGRPMDAGSYLRGRGPAVKDAGRG